MEKGEVRGHERKVRREWTDEEFGAFMAHGKPPKRPDYREGVWLLRWTGLRKNELQTLRWGDVFIDGENRFLMIRANVSKNRREEQVPLMRKVVERLRELRPVDFDKNTRILTNKLPGSEQLRADLERCGLDYRNDFGDLDFHSLRHTFGFWLAQNGYSMPMIQAILWHSDSRTTEKHYVNVPKLAENLVGSDFGNQGSQVSDSLTNRLTNASGSEGQTQSRSVTSGYIGKLLQALDKKVDSLNQAHSDTMGLILKMAGQTPVKIRTD